MPADELDPKLVGVYPVTQIGATTKTEPEVDDLNRTVTLATVTDETIKDLRSALMGMNVKRAVERKLWIDVLESLASLKETPFA
jgi:hypothetical protein